MEKIDDGLNDKTRNCVDTYEMNERVVSMSRNKL